MKQFFIIILTLFSFEINYSQKPSYIKKLFIDAEYFVLFNEYNEALPLYLEIFGYQPDNMNIAYRIGECYINIPGDKLKAIIYLEKAAENVTMDYKTGIFTENKAPKEVLYYLGIAYRINNEIDKSIEYFEKYLKLLGPFDLDKKQNTNFQIQKCKYAIEMMKKPVKINEINLGGNINTSFSNVKPVFSAVDSSLFFISKLRFYDGVFWSKMENGNWSMAGNITPFLNVDGNVNTCSVSLDGKTIYLNKYDWDNYNIYISKFENRVWGDIEKFDKMVNTKYNETHASESSEGKTIFFVSDREGGIGGKDIYQITLDNEGNWKEPELLSSDINTPYDEETPFITPQGRLYFSSMGHENMGGFDIFYSDFINNNWTKPINLGYPVNTTDDDLHFAPINENTAYYSLIRKDGFGGFDIYKIEFFNK